jgi:hypothetical protein
MADEEKEAWPAPGINFNRLGSDDPKRAEEHLARMPAQARIKWLDRFEVEYNYVKSQSRISPGSKSDWQLRLLNEMEARCYERHRYLTRMEELEAKSQAVEESGPARDRLTPAPADSEGTVDAHAPGRWTNEQIAVALYALLRASGMPEKHNKIAVARFAHLLTGRSQDKMRKVGYDVVGKLFSDAKARDVIEQFEQLGLTKLADAIRNKDFTKL